MCPRINPSAHNPQCSLIEYNLDAVDAAIDAVNAALASGMDWRELETMIREERRCGEDCGVVWWKG